MNKFLKYQRLTCLAAMLLVAATAFCIPAKPVWRSVKLTDGTTVEVMKIGDEHGHWYVDRQGNPLMMVGDGKAEYITTERLDGLKAARTLRADRINAVRMERISKTRALSAPVAGGKARVIGEPSIIMGEKRGLVILVNFANKSFLKANTKERFERRFNEVGYSEKGYVGSVHDYFYDQSYGKFDPTFDIVGPVTLSKDYSYYGENNKNGDDKRPGTMVIETVKLADALGVDFSKYDWDGDGEVDQVFLVYAGTGEADSDVEDEIWPHEYTLTEAKYFKDGDGPQTIDGVVIDTYAATCELANSRTIDGIGTACHEFSHCFGLPDFYDPNYSGGQGMLYWDLLCSGSYNGPTMHSEVPAPYTSYERIFAGWMDPIVLDSPQSITDMPALQDEPVAYKIINDAHPDEYYLLENRQAKKWDLYTAGNGDGNGHGMLILHVDYNKSDWKENIPNGDPEHQRMTYFPADNSYGTTITYNGLVYWNASFKEFAGDVFPGTKDNTSFTDDTKPAATLYNANTDGRKFMGKPITDITESADGLISFNFMMEQPSAIDALQDDPQTDSQYIYNLNGQRVSADYKGIVIQSGRKVLKR